MIDMSEFWSSSWGAGHDIPPWSFSWAGQTFKVSFSGFTACDLPDEGYKNPLYVVARSAARHLDNGGQLQLPDGYNSEVLENIQIQAGWRDHSLRVSPQQASEIASLGRQLLDLDGKQALDPPLPHKERQVVKHMVSVVGQMAREQGTVHEGDIGL